MALDLQNIFIYHITDIDNLPSILKLGGLYSDAAIQNKNLPSAAIAYDHIKQRRLNEIRISCCDNAFVGEFVPFYFCPRSPMLFVVNKGTTGRAMGCQESILHLVSTVKYGLNLNKPWAISDGNAGARFTSFGNLEMLDNLDWLAISTNDWAGNTHKKSAEFLVKDFFPWSSFISIGCYNRSIAANVNVLLRGHSHCPSIEVKSNWYY